jgi:hypothetical protein
VVDDLNNAVEVGFRDGPHVHDQTSASPLSGRPATRTNVRGA